MSKIDNEITNLAEQMFKSTHSKELVMDMIMELGPDNLKKALPSLSDEEKLLLQECLQDLNKAKSPSMDDTYVPKKTKTSSHQMSQESLSGSDDEDEKNVKPENAKKKHQGDNAPEGFEGQVIKGESPSMDATYTPKKTKTSEHNMAQESLSGSDDEDEKNVKEKNKKVKPQGDNAPEGFEGQVIKAEEKSDEKNDGLAKGEVEEVQKVSEQDVQEIVDAVEKGYAPGGGISNAPSSGEEMDKAGTEKACKACGKVHPMAGPGEKLEKECSGMKKGSGVGTRGGKIIGYTKTSKPIYARHNEQAVSGYSKEDHLDAATIHRKAKEKAASQTVKEHHQSMMRRHQKVAIRERGALEKGGPGSGRHPGYFSGHTGYIPPHHPDHGKAKAYINNLRLTDLNEARRLHDKHMKPEGAGSYIRKSDSEERELNMNEEMKKSVEELVELAKSNGVEKEEVLKALSDAEYDVEFVKDLFKGKQEPSETSQSKPTGQDKGSKEKIPEERGELMDPADAEETADEACKKVKKSEGEAAEEKVEKSEEVKAEEAVEKSEPEAKAEEKVEKSEEAPAEEKVEKSVVWTPKNTLAANSLGRNCHYEVNDMIEKSEQETAELKKSGGYRDDVAEEAKLEKSEGEAKEEKADLNDLIEKGMDYSSNDVERLRQLSNSKVGSGVIMQKSFSDEEMEQVLHMNKKTSKEVLGEE